jgi:hypothetical protein
MTEIQSNIIAGLLGVIIVLNILQLRAIWRLRNRLRNLRP